MSNCLSNSVRTVRKHLAALGLATLALVSCTRGPGGEQTLVDRATLTVQELMTQNVSQDPKTLLRRDKGVLICPRVFKAGFFIGGEGGSCVLVARSGNGTWSYPAFYDIGSGSFGFQFGIEDSQVRLGGNASIAVASVGASVGGATTAAVGADIVAFAEARGLFGGVSLEGGVMSARTDENQGYYGQPFAARQIIFQMQGVNPGADPLREILTRYGGPGAPAGSAYPPPGYPPAQGVPPQPAPGFQPAPGYPPAGQGAQPLVPSQPVPPATYQPQPAYPPASQPVQPPTAYQPRPAPAPAPAYSPPPSQAPSGYQPPPGQFTYPPAAGSGPVQEQALPAPGR